MSKVKVGLVQMSCTANKEENLQKAIVKVKEAAAKGAQIVCLQELFTSLYFCDVEDYDNFKLAEPIPGPSTEALGKVALPAGLSRNPGPAFRSGIVEPQDRAFDIVGHTCRDHRCLAIEHALAGFRKTERLCQRFAQGQAYFYQVRAASEQGVVT